MDPLGVHALSTSMHWLIGRGVRSMVEGSSYASRAEGRTFVHLCSVLKERWVSRRFLPESLERPPGALYGQVS